MSCLKVITEAILRLELKATEPEVYYIPEGKILSPAAREYLQQRKIKIPKGSRPLTLNQKPPRRNNRLLRLPSRRLPPQNSSTMRPAHGKMTHLHGNVLVSKADPRILFRGKLDSLQAQVALAQATIHEEGGSIKLIDDLGDILGKKRE